MRHLSLIFYLCLLAGPGSAQHSVKLTVEEKPTKWVESRISENNEIVLKASGIISQVEIDSVKNILYAVITPEVNNKKTKFNYLIAYDLIEGRELWIREIIPDNKFLMIDTMPAVSGKGSAVFYPTDGKEMWSSTAKLFHFSKKSNIILGYDLESKKLVGMEFLTGKTLWHDFMPDRNLQSILFLGDTGMVLMGHYPQFYDLMKGKVRNTDEKIRSYLNANDSTPDAGIRLALHINYHICPRRFLS